MIAWTYPLVELDYPWQRVPATCAVCSRPATQGVGGSTGIGVQVSETDPRTGSMVPEGERRAAYACEEHYDDVSFALLDSGLGFTWPVTVRPGWYEWIMYKSPGLGSVGRATLSLRRWWYGRAKS